MALEMRMDQLFRIKGLAGRTDNLEIKITAFYGGGRSAEQIADLAAKRCDIEGMSVIIGADELDLGRSFRSNVTGFSVELSDRVCSIEQLSLRYAVCAAADLMNKDYYPEYSRLACGSIRFTLDGDRFVADMRENARKEAVPREEAGYDADDIIGDIKADLSIISFYPNSGGREELEGALNRLLSDVQSGERPLPEISTELREREKQVVGYINSSADYFKGSGKHLLEKSAAKGR